MSRSEWESGTIKLPTAEFARVRQVVADCEAARQAVVFDHTQEFWGGLTRKQKSDPAAYLDAAHTYTKAESDRVNTENRKLSIATWRTPEPIPDFSEHVYDALTRSRTPRRVLKNDMSFPNNKTLYFEDGEAHVSFDREDSSVTWSANGDNHAVDFAQNKPLAADLFTALGTVKWTRDTGGVLTGNDEYNDGPQGEGTGADYVTRGFGPRGAEQAPHATPAYQTATGARVNPMSAIMSGQDRRRNGQFDYRRGSAPEIRLR